MMSGILPEGLTMRPPTLDDLQSAYELNREYNMALYGEEEFSLEDLRRYWTAPKHDLARDQRLVFDQDGQLIANLYMDQRQYAKFFVDVVVRPGYGDPRVGDYLLELTESFASEQMVQAEPHVRVTLNGGANSADQDGQQRYARHGFQEVRRFWMMAIEIHEAPPLPVWPKGVELRPFVPERDARAVFDMMETAFNDHWGHMPGNFEEWRHRKIEHADFDASLWHIAYECEQIVGGALCSGSSAPGWVDTLGTLRSQRRKGLGMALLHHSFGDFYRRGIHEVVLGVDSQNLTGATRLYQRAGMHIKREHVSFEKELRAGVELSTQVLAV